VLWRNLQYSAVLPIPNVARIIPYLFSYWNVYKSGSDTTTKLMDELTTKIPVDGLQAYAVARILLVLSVVIYRLTLVATARKPVDDYFSVARWRNAASKRLGYKRALGYIAKLLLVEGDSSSDSDSDSGGGQTTLVRTARATRTRLEAQVYQSWATAPTGGTPRRKKKETVFDRDTGELNEKQVQAKRCSELCPGAPFLRVNPELLNKKNVKKNDGEDARGSCGVCGMRTSTFCLFCRRWFCYGWETNERETGGPILLQVPMGPATVMKRNSEGKRKCVKEEQMVVCWNTCFHKAHKNGYDHMLSSMDGNGLDDVTTNLDFSG
jgi:hypothetical protein